MPAGEGFLLSTTTSSLSTAVLRATKALSGTSGCVLTPDNLLELMRTAKTRPGSRIFELRKSVRILA